MNINISLDNLDKAIEQLNDLQNRLESFPEHLAKSASDDIKSHYAITVTSQDGNTTIDAERKGIAFIEYGAGFYADETSIGDLESYPGVWSEDHAQTFQNWNGEEDKYPYNMYPHHYMESVVQTLETDAERIARDYFK